MTIISGLILYVVILRMPQVVVCILGLNLRKKRGSPILWEFPLRRFLLLSSLSTETKLLNDSSVSLDITSLEVVKDTTTLTYKLKK